MIDVDICCAQRCILP